MKIDARGIACPGPVIMTKKELNKIDEGRVEVTVDNPVSAENLEKLAKAEGCDCEVSKFNDSEYSVSITKNRTDESSNEQCGAMLFSNDFTLGIGSEYMGNGDETLGRILMKSYIYTVSETDPLPSTIVFFNGGVKLTVNESEVLDDLRNMEENGVEIISCGTCLDFYELKEQLAVGSISNMYTIYEKLRDSGRNIVIG